MSLWTFHKVLRPSMFSTPRFMALFTLRSLMAMVMAPPGSRSWYTLSMACVRHHFGGLRPLRSVWPGWAISLFSTRCASSSKTIERRSLSTLMICWPLANLLLSLQRLWISLEGSLPSSDCASRENSLEFNFTETAAHLLPPPN